MPITAVALDGGNWTETVAQFVKSKVGQSGAARILTTTAGYVRQSVYLVRGRNERKSERAVYRPRKTEVNQCDKTIARSVGVWGVGGSVLKHMVYGGLRAALATQYEASESGDAEEITARMLRFPGGRSDEVHDPLNPDPGAMPHGYYKSLTVEYFDEVGGSWIRPKGAANEALDAIVYAIWASLAPALKADVIRESQWAALEAAYQPAEELFSVVADSRETQRHQPDNETEESLVTSDLDLSNRIMPKVAAQQPRFRRGMRSARGGGG